MIDNNFRKENYCPYCNHHVDRASIPGKEEEIPIVGDLSVCIRCGGLSEFGEKMILKKQDVMELTLDEARKINLYQIAIQQINKER